MATARLPRENTAPDQTDHSMIAEFSRIINSERVSGLKLQVPRNSKVTTMRKLGVFPTKPRDSSISPHGPGANKTRAQLKPAGGRAFPPLVLRKVNSVAHHRRREDKSNFAQRSMSTPGDMELHGIKCEKPTGGEKDSVPEVVPPGFPHMSEKGRAYMRTPGGDPRTLEKPVQVTYFVDTDFGFHADRQRQTSGLSLQKHIHDKGQLAKEIEKTAERHINAMMTSGLNSRSSKRAENVQNLMTTMSIDLTRRRASPNPQREYSLLANRPQVAREDTVDDRASPARMVMSSRRPTIKSGGCLPPLEKDISSIAIVGKEPQSKLSQATQ